MSLYDEKTLIAFADYLENHKITKLHLGAGNIHLDGWLNTDIEASVENKIYYFNMLIFPYIFKNDSFDYIFSEHNFEHFEINELFEILKECHRILKTNGVIRIATPNLKNLINYYQKNLEIYDDYTKWEIDAFIPFAKEHNLFNKTIVFNNFFKCWGHKFIYDYETMKDLLNIAGFSKIRQCSIQKSRHKSLANIESHGRNIGETFNKIETMVIEAEK